MGKNAAEASTVIGLSLSYEHLEHVLDTKSAFDMWTEIMHFFGKENFVEMLNRSAPTLQCKEVKWVVRLYYDNIATYY